MADDGHHDTAVNFSSKPTQVTVLPAVANASSSTLPSRSRTGSDASLTRTIEFYGVRPPSQNSLHRHASMERRTGRTSPAPAAPRDPDRYSELSRPPVGQPSAHSASILPSASFFNPKRPPGSMSPHPPTSPKGTAASASRFSTLGSSLHQDDAPPRRNGPLITRIQSEFATQGGEQLLTRRLSDEFEEEENLRRLSHLSPSTDRVHSPAFSHASRPISPELNLASNVSALTSPSALSLPVRASTETQDRQSLATTQPSSLLTGKESREPLLDFPSTTKRLDGSSFSPNRSRAVDDELRVSSIRSVDKAVQRARNSFSVNRSPAPSNASPLVGSQHLHDEELPASAASPAPLQPAVQIPLTPVTNEKGRPMRNYELHQGSNRFLFKGKLVSSKDNPVPFIVSLVLAIVLPILWFAFSGPFLWTHLGGGGKASIFVFVYLYLVMLVNMCKTAWRDPGIIPRGLDKMPERKWLEDADGLGNAGWKAEPKYMRMKEGVVASKWCDTCGTYRPPRTSHCRLCDNCVEHTDHHCTFLNNCIGRRNYTSFFAFLVTAIICSVYAISFSAYHIAARHNEDPAGSWASRWDTAGSLAVAVLTFLFLCPIIGLFGYHVRLLWVNRTTIEMLRPKGDRSGGINPADGTATGNLYSLQSPFANMISLLCRPMEVPSWIAPSRYAQTDAREELVNQGYKEEV